MGNREGRLDPILHESELGSAGIDEALQGLSADPFGSPVGTSPYLRIPSFVNTPATRYVFCLASKLTAGRTRLRGLRQGLSIGWNAAIGDPAPGERPFRVEVKTPTWRFSDGNVSWHLVKEKPRRRTTNEAGRGILRQNTSNFRYLEADGPALVYLDATFNLGAVDPATGAPFFYNVGMTGYTPPPIWADWEGIAGLGNFHEIRFPRSAPDAWNSLDVVIEGEWRVSLYATVLQTNPDQRTAFDGSPALLEASTFAAPEEAILIARASDGGPQPIYWDVFGGLVFEDDEEVPL